MRILRVFLGLIKIRLLGKILIAVFRSYELPGLGERVVGNPHGVGAHVGDEADLALFAQLHAFIKSLRQTHGALHREAQLARGILLECAGGKRRSRRAAALFLLDGADLPLGLFQRRPKFAGLFFVGDFRLLLAAPHEARIELWRLGGSELGVDRPVFFFLEGADLALALYDQAQRHRLHPAGGEPAPDFVPQQRRDLIADNAVEHASRLLRIHQVLVDLPRMLESFLHRPLGDLIESDAMDRDAVRLLATLAAAIARQFLGEMRRDGFAFAIRIGGEIDSGR